MQILKGELLGIYIAEAKDLIKHELFQPMCDVAIELAVKDNELRSFVSFLHDIRGVFHKLDKKKVAE